MSNETHYDESANDRDNKARHRDYILSQILDVEGYSIILDDESGTCAEWMKNCVFQNHRIYFVNFPENDTEMELDAKDIRYDTNKILLNMRMWEAINYIYEVENSKCNLMWYDSTNGFGPNTKNSKLRCGFKFPKENLITMIENNMFDRNALLYLNLNNARHNKGKVNQKNKVNRFLDNNVIENNGYSLIQTNLEPYTDRIQQMLFYEFKFES